MALTNAQKQKDSRKRKADKIKRWEEGLRNITALSAAMVPGKDDDWTHGYTTALIHVRQALGLAA